MGNTPCCSGTVSEHQPQTRDASTATTPTLRPGLAASSVSGASTLWPTLERFVREECERLDREKVTPWAFFLSALGAIDAHPDTTGIFFASTPARMRRAGLLREQLHRRLWKKCYAGHYDDLLGFPTVSR